MTNHDEDQAVLLADSVPLHVERWVASLVSSNS